MGPSDIKPCPFCGGKAQIKKTMQSGSQSTTMCAYKLRCTKCLTERRPITKLEDAIRSWNTRIKE